MKITLKSIFSFKNLIRLALVIAAMYGIMHIISWNNARKERIRIANLKDTSSPNVQTFEDFAMIKGLNRKARIRVYLPPNHDTDSIRYPVLYMLDGENLFSEKSSGGIEWRVDEVLDSTIALGQKAAIIVGVDAPDKGRNLEYKPFNPKTNKDSEGKLLLDFIAYDLKPKIDSLYKTLPDMSNTGIGGCSLGGIMALHGIANYQDVFGTGVLFSPSLWVSERFYQMPSLIKDWNGRRVFINVGDSEGFMDDDATKLHKAFLEAGIPSENLKFSIEKGMGHYHLTWQLGFQKAYPWIVQ